MKGRESQGEQGGAVGSTKGEKDDTCWNCSEKGHYKDKCPKPNKSTDEKRTTH